MILYICTATNIQSILAMKISIASILVCAFALTQPFASLAGEKKESYEEKKERIATFDASLYKMKDSNKVRLLVDANENDHIRVLLKDQSGKILFSKTVNKGDMKNKQAFSLIFNLDEMREGTYFVHVRDKRENSVVKEISIENLHTKIISVQ